MLKRILASSAALALFALPLAAQAAARPASDEVTITGQVIDVYCNTTMGAAGAGHKACAEACAKSGEALAILSSDGTIYMPVSAKPGDPQNPRLLPFAEGKVKVTGTHRVNHGLHTVEIKTIEAAT
jgi:type 1 fimbria pilin